jgi:hypothetical protein
MGRKMKPKPTPQAQPIKTVRLLLPDVVKLVKAARDGFPDQMKRGATEQDIIASILKVKAAKAGFASFKMYPDPPSGDLIIEFFKEGGSK